MEAEEQTKNTAPPQQDSKKDFRIPMPVTANTSNPEAGGHAENARDGTEFWPPLFGYRLKITDTLLVAFTALLFAATVFLYRATRDLVQGAEITAERQLRAYVSAAPNIIFPFDAKTTVEMGFRVENHGQTPARNVRCCAVVDVLPYPLPPNYIFHEPTIQTRSGGLACGEHVDIRMAAKRYFGNDEIKKVLVNDGCRIYLYGTLKYEDAFDRTRTTQFCRSVVGCGDLAAMTVPDPTPHQRVIAFDIADQHNETD